MSKPLWSVTIPTYNAGRYLEQTLRSLLAQDPGAEKMEIIVVDNRSTDDTLTVVRRVAGDRVRVVVNERNVGVHGNYNRCIEVSTGALLHILHADDIVNAGFYARYEEEFGRHSQVYLLCCNANFINAQGQVTGSTKTPVSLSEPTNDLTELLYINRIVAPSVVIRRDGYESVGGFDTAFSFVGDWEMWARVIYNFKGLYLPDVLMQYRIHDNNGTFGLVASGESVLDHERIYHKFSRLGYGIDMTRAGRQLVSSAANTYVRLHQAGNVPAQEKILELMSRYRSKWQVKLLLAIALVRMNMGKVKRSVVG